MEKRFVQRQTWYKGR